METHNNASNKPILCFTPAKIQLEEKLQKR